MLLAMQFTALFAGTSSRSSPSSVSARSAAERGWGARTSSRCWAGHATISTAITPPSRSPLGGGGAVAVFCMATLGERFLFRVLPYWKLGLLAAGIVLILAPGHLGHALAILCAAAVLVSEWRNRHPDSATPIGDRKLP